MKISTTQFLFLLSFSLTTFFSNADTFDSDGVEIFYTVQGDGEPVVLIHGFTASAMSNFGVVGITSGLSSKYKVIAIDNRGHGASGKPHDPSAYGEQMVNDVINLMDHLDIEKSSLVGYSMGGMITQKLITLYPERVVSAVVGGSGWVGDEGTPLGENLSLLVDSLEAGNGIGPLIIALTPSGQPAPTPELIAMTNQALMATNDPLALAAAVRGFGELSNVSSLELRSNTIPLVYVVGELDPLKADVERAMGVASNARSIVLPASDHMSAVAHPMLLESIQSFLAENATK